jgi:hypothetical protein
LPGVIDLNEFLFSLTITICIWAVPFEEDTFTVYDNEGKTVFVFVGLLSCGEDPVSFLSCESTVSLDESSFAVALLEIQDSDESLTIRYRNSLAT